MSEKEIRVENLTGDELDRWYLLAQIEKSRREVARERREREDKLRASIKGVYGATLYE